MLTAVAGIRYESVVHALETKVETITMLLRYYGERLDKYFTGHNNNNNNRSPHTNLLQCMCNLIGWCRHVASFNEESQEDCKDPPTCPAGAHGCVRCVAIM